jgi:GNAT superfamily N-acetyltransferase
MHLRRAVPDDGPTFLRHVHELAAFEKMEGPTKEAEARLLADAFGPRPRFDLWVPEVDGNVVGYAVTFETYSTFLAKPVLYLEDIYVTPSARRGGVASATMRFLAQEAVRRGCGRMAWVVLDWNVDAQALYRRLGGGPMQGWLPFAIQGDALSRLAEI